LKKALVTGISGQDGAYLAKWLLDKGYEVHGALRRRDDAALARLNTLGLDGRVVFHAFELSDAESVRRVVSAVRPDEVYNLGAQSSVGASLKDPLGTADVNALGPLRLLEALRAANPAARFYQASSCEMFGPSSESPQNEKTPFRPASPYAAARVFAHWTVVNYREAFGLFACSAILYNHESPLRGPNFVSRKISMAAARIKAGLQDELVLGNLDVVRDWGYAPEFVEAIWLMLQQPEADDYVIATGESHTVREFCEKAFQRAGFRLRWEGKGAHEAGVDASSGRRLVRVDPKLFRAGDVGRFEGDASKARARLGWRPRTSFADLVALMVDSDAALAARETAGARPA